MEYLKYTPEVAKDWKNGINFSEGYLRKRVLNSMNESQLVSKMWLVEELLNLNVIFLFSIFSSNFCVVSKAIKLP